jgi:hypothetical protein
MVRRPRHVQARGPPILQGQIELRRTGPGRDRCSNKILVSCIQNDCCRPNFRTACLVELDFDQNDVTELKDRHPISRTRHLLRNMPRRTDQGLAASIPQHRCRQHQEEESRAMKILRESGRQRPEGLGSGRDLLPACRIPVPSSAKLATIMSHLPTLAEHTCQRGLPATKWRTGPC